MVDIVAGRWLLLGDQARSGGQSTVRKATSVADGTPVAVKMLTMGRDEILAKVFERETRTLADLDHPNIIKLLDHGVAEDGTPFLVLEWIENSLAGVLTAGEPYGWPDLAERLADPVLSAVSYAHLKGIEHRDIKPGNILLRSTGEPVLADFGIAKLRSDLGASELTVASFRSRPYAPPEESSAVPYVRDVYSLGVLLLQALSTTRLRDFPDVAPALDAVPVPPQVRDLLRRCVSTEISERPQNGAVLLQEFTRAASAARSGRAVKPAVQLVLTNSARADLASAFDVDPAAAEGQLQRDLAADTFAEFQLDRKTGLTDRKVVQLVGDRCSYRLKIDNSESYLVVVGARGLEYDRLEAIRRRSMPTRDLVAWTCAASRDRASAARSVALLVHALSDHDDERHSSNRAGQESGSWFDGWLRLLTAQEEIARGDRPTLRYTSYERNGREADFRIANPVEADLLGTDMQVFVEASGRGLTRGEIIDQDSRGVTLRAAVPFPSLPAQGLLIPFHGPTAIAVQRQRDAVTAIKDGGAARTDLREIVLKPDTVRPPAPVVVDSWRAPHLDQSKKAAVEATLGAPDVTLVEGPPGTGKTTLIAELVAQTLARDSDARILIVSQTHVAVDNAVERLDAAGIPRVVRLGADESRVDSRVRHLLLEDQMPKWAAGVRRRAEAYFRDRSKAVELSEGHLRAALCLEEIVGVSAEIDQIQRHIERETDRSRSSAAAGGGGGVQLTERMDQLDRRRTALVEEAEKHLAGDLTLNPTMSGDDAQHAVAALVGDLGDGPDLLRILDLQAQWLRRVSSDENLAESFLQSRSVIAGTCIGFLRHPAVRDLDFDLCILDEASKATATEALVPMARAKRWLLIGDSRQLPPLDEEVLRRPQLMEEHDLDEDLVRRTLFQHFVDELPDHSRRMLTDQWRMVRPIGDLVSHCFYDGRLHSPNTTGLPGFDLLGKPVLWIDTAGMGSERRETAQAGGTSYANRAEARIVFERLKVIDGAVDRGVIVVPESSHLSVLLIAPYRSQVEELARRATKQRFRHIQVEVQTVDAVQGREADLAIFSVTRSNPAGRLGFLGADYWRRINVALSRARFGLTIVGDAEFCTTTPGALQSVQRYISANPSTCEIRSAADAQS